MRNLLFFLAAAAAFGQSNGRVAGQVQDAKQAAIPGARVTVQDSERGFRREVRADGLGRYSAPDLPIGRYQVTAEAPGFAARTVTGLTLTVGAVLAVDLQLEVAGVTERVEV
ncbi:MAG: carboxypeptidase-like regulatory domain-containing protein [Acidobacteriota bacterium]